VEVDGVVEVVAVAVALAVVAVQVFNNFRS